ncbi:MAG: hypothetical protein VB115_09535 [Christensenellaceae bacterium]|nr:hypothetical protein [Christensenellaceae bacterium]
MRTVSIQSVCEEFKAAINGIQCYVAKCKQVFSEDKLFLSYGYENAVIMLYKSFERFVLRTMIACLNRDHSHCECKYSIKLGKHINDDVCEFLITKGGFFDFKGRSGLNKVLNDIIGTNHNIAKVFKSTAYKSTIDQLCAIRNYAAHNSAQSKQAAMETLGLRRISSAGSCLKTQHRFESLTISLTSLADTIKATPM